MELITILVGVPSGLLALTAILRWLYLYFRKRREEAVLMVPFGKPGSFFGRDADLQALHKVLLKDRGVSARPVGLTGLGGIGKTQLAVEYAYRYRDSFPGGVFWLDGAEPLADGFAAIGRRLLPASTLYQDDENLVGAAFDYLAKTPSTLLILDNLENPAVIQQPVGRRPEPESLPSRILFTTRRRDFDPARFEVIEVGVLPEGAALKLLLRHQSRHLARDPAHPQHGAARTICAMLGYLPLAVEIAGGHVGWLRPDLPLDAYLQELECGGALPVLEYVEGPTTAEDLAKRHVAGVEATLESQWGTLETGEDSANGGEGDARLILLIGGQLAEASIVPKARLGLLAGFIEEGGGFFGTRLDRALRRLVNVSLLEELQDDRVRLHPLVREFANRKTPEAEAPEFKQRCAVYLALAFEDIETLFEQYMRRGIDELQADLIAARAFAGDAQLLGRLGLLQRVLGQEAHNLRVREEERREVYFVQQVGNRALGLGLSDLDVAAKSRLKALDRPSLGLSWRATRESPDLVRNLSGHEGWVNAVAVTTDGRYAVSGSWDYTLKVWEVETGRQVRTLSGHENTVNAVAVTTNGRYAVSGSSDRTLKVWEVETGREVRTLPGHEKAVNAVAVTPDGRYAVSGSYDSTLKVWEVETGREVRTLSGHEGIVEAVAVTPDGRYAISGSNDRTLKVWEVETGRQVRTLSGHEDAVNAVAVTTDGRYAVSGSSDHTLKVWEVETGRQVRTFSGHTTPIRAVAVTPDGRYALTGSLERTLKVWEVETGRQVRTLSGHENAVNAVAVTTNGRYAVSGSSDHTLKVWEVETGRHVRTLSGHLNAVNAVAVTPDGRYAVSGSVEGTLKVWEVETGREVRTLSGHENWVTAVAVTPDGRYAVSGSFDRTLKVWEVETGREVRTLSGHEDGVNAVAVTPDGRYAVSGSFDRTLKVWEVETGRQVRTLSGHETSVLAVAVTTDGRYAVSGSLEGTVKVWEMEMGEEVAAVALDAAAHCVAVPPNGVTVVVGDGAGAVYALRLRAMPNSQD